MTHMQTRVTQLLGLHRGCRRYGLGRDGARASLRRGGCELRERELADLRARLPRGARLWGARATCPVSTG